MQIVPFDDRDGTIWYDGKMVDWRDAKVHVLNHSLHYGGCAFEGLRVYGGNIFKLREHTERLFKSAELLGYTIPYTVEQIEKATKEVVKAQKIVDGYIRPFCWRGSEKMAISAQNNTVHVAIAAWTWPAYYADRTQGIRLTFSDWQRPAPDTAPTASKASGLYMICTLSKHKAEAAGFQEALMLDYRGYVAEATSANFFMVVNGELHTPIADCFLNGITRLTVIDLAKKRGIKVVERHFGPEELGKAQEAFLTGTAAEITPIREISGKHGDFKFVVGDVTKQLMDDYTNLVNQKQMVA